MKEKKNLILQYFLLYLGISLGGMALPTYLSRFVGTDMVLILTLLSSTFIVIKSRKKIVQTTEFLVYILTLFVFLCLVVFSSGLTLGTSLNCILILTLVYATFLVNPTKIFIRFISLTFIISCISLLFFIPQYIVGINTYDSLFPYLMPSYSRNEIYSYGGFLYQFVFLHQNRNCGPFGEPGEFQCILNVALYFTLFIKGIGFTEKKRILYSLIFIATLITAQSTSGYIGLSAIIIVFIFSKRKFSKKNQIRFLSMIGFLIIIFFVSGMFSDFIKTTIIDKFSYSAHQNSIETLNSGQVRTESIIGILNTIKNEPTTLWGIGYDEIQRRGLEGCAGILAQLVAIGILPFILLWGYPIYKKIKHNYGKEDILISLFLVLNMGLGQPHILNTSLFIMLFHGWFNKIRKTHISHKLIKEND